MRDLSEIYIKDLYAAWVKVNPSGLQLTSYSTDLYSKVELEQYDTYHLLNVLNDLRHMRTMVEGNLKFSPIDHLESPEDSILVTKIKTLLSISRMLLPFCEKTPPKKSKLPSYRIQSSNPTKPKALHKPIPQKLAAEKQAPQQPQQDQTSEKTQKTDESEETYHSLIKNHKPEPPSRFYLTEQVEKSDEISSKDVSEGAKSTSELKSSSGSSSKSTNVANRSRRYLGVADSLQAEKLVAPLLNLSPEKKIKVEEIIKRKSLPQDAWTKYCELKMATASPLIDPNSGLDETIEITKFEFETMKMHERRQRSLNLKTMSLTLSNPEDRKFIRQSSGSLWGESLEFPECDGTPLSKWSIPSAKEMESSHTFIRDSLEQFPSNLYAHPEGSSPLVKLPPINNRPSSKHSDRKNSARVSNIFLQVPANNQNDPNPPSPDFPRHNFPGLELFSKTMGSPNPPITDINSPFNPKKGALKLQPVKAFESFSGSFVNTGSPQKVLKVKTPSVKKSRPNSRASTQGGNRSLNTSLNKSLNDSNHTILKVSQVPTVESNNMPSKLTLGSKSSLNLSCENASVDQMLHAGTDNEIHDSTLDRELERDLSEYCEEEKSNLRDSLEPDQLAHSKVVLKTIVSFDSLDKSTRRAQSNSFFNSTAELEYKGNLTKEVLLGHGAEAKVYRCTIEDYEGYIALKQYEILRKGKDAGDTYSDIKKEFNMLRHIQHPNIIQYMYLYRPPAMISNCLEFGFIMEYLEGGSLDTYIEESFAGITYEQKLSILRQILLGLETLHQNKIIHRDLKPGNILLSKDKSSVKISDFGISIKTNNDSNTKRTFVGTPWYMAPEVIKSEAYSSKADIWSVGCCFYHLLTGKKPYNNAGRYQVMFLMIKKSPLEASSAEIQKMIDAYPEARDFLEKCFLKDKGERPTASELLQLPLFQGLEPLNDSLQILESN